MKLRAGILITGTEVLTGIIQDRNGPWLSERMRDVGIEVAQITIVGDRPEDLLQALEGMAAEGLSLIATSGGLGPTADDLTAEVVGRLQGRAMVLDEALEGRIAEILKPLMARWPNIDQEAVRTSNRKQAVIPEGSTILEPVGTAPGLVVPPSTGSGPTVLVLPGPPRELHPMWHTALETEAMRAVLADAPVYERRMIRMFGIPESELAMTLRSIEADGVDLSEMEITTCLRRGEIEIATTFEKDRGDLYSRFENAIVERHSDVLFSLDERTIDRIVAEALAGRTIATGESCTAGLLAARLADQPGASEYLLGGVVAYSNRAKSDQLGVAAELIEEHGAVSEQVAVGLAEGARDRFGSEIGVGITGVAGPGGGTEAKPVGLVWFAVVGESGTLSRSIQVPGNRADVRERSTTIALHLIRRTLNGDGDFPS